LQIACESQAEVDHFWNEFTREGSEGPCGWLKDKFGLSWQVVPTRLLDMLTDGDPQKVARVTAAYLQMTKFDLSALERAYTGK
jgi:predicted 3-demethylubiquinone-9 3-methyltransferase (glyoxalase superfamily)